MKTTTKIISLITSTCFVLSILMTSGLTASCAEEPTKPEVKAWDGTYDTSWYDAQDSELHIFTAEELAGLAYLVNEGQKTFEGQTVYLESDINLDGAKWIPIGSDKDKTFLGIFDGQTHTVEKMTTAPHIITESTDPIPTFYAGLFGYLSGEVRNIILLDCEVKDNAVTGGLASRYVKEMYLGGISGFAEKGLISNCVITGNISSSSPVYTYGTTNSWCGGISGWCMNCTISQCRSNCTIIADTLKAYGGGITGTMVDSLLRECCNYGDITSKTCTGGLVGSMRDSSIKDSYNCGLLSSENDAGGIVCITNNKSELYNVFNTGLITAKTVAAGIIAKSTAETQLEKVYYMTSTAAKGVGQGEDTSIAKSSANMKKEDFAKLLGEAFMYIEDSYPKLSWELEDENTNTETSIIENQVKVGKSIQMIITNYTGKVTWLSKNPELLTIDSEGVATGLKAGKAEVYAVLDSGKALSGIIEVLPGEETTTSAATTTVSTSTTTKPTTTFTTSTTTKPTTTVTTTTTTTSATTSTTITISETKPTEPDYILGDVNEDNEISVEDAQLALIEYVSTMSGLDGSFTEKQKLAGDVNGDQQISVEDAQTILIYYVSNTLSGQSVTWDELLGKTTPTKPLPQALIIRYLNLVYHRKSL